MDGKAFLPCKPVPSVATDFHAPRGLLAMVSHAATLAPWKNYWLTSSTAKRCLAASAPRGCCELLVGQVEAAHSAEHGPIQGRRYQVQAQERKGRSAVYASSDNPIAVGDGDTAPKEAREPVSTEAA
ncbi:hypothetical protein HPB52_025266 [Rhipicephalus sanguineus]|uniref:Uncharacterized protein n=1 Tax=Rhipicephalus sanguineus TaxID=34632 RepID=A0A9D4TD89_RHISA|nr:hypothetical protein HPB52_025266 [Rhipicephalus sanguineus]